VDIGNTNIVFGLYDGTRLAQTFRVETARSRTADEYGVLVGQMLNTYYKARATSSPLQNPLVAEARQTLYRSREEDAGALIALDNVIVASSVPPDGTRGSASGPALVGTVHDTAKTEEDSRDGARSYTVAWQPLKALDGTAIGAIGIARPAKEMEGAAEAVRATTFLIGAIASLLAGGAGYMFGRGLGSRIEDLGVAAGRWGLGDLSTPARDLEPFLARWIPVEFLRDEINQLAQQLDQLRETFRQAIERIRKR